MNKQLALGWLVAVTLVGVLLGAGPAVAASPWDGEWEGEIKQPRLTCAPCKIKMTVQDGVPNVRGDVSVQTFTIDSAGQINAFVILPIGYAADCSLRGQINGNQLTATGRCVGSRVESPELILRRVSSTAGLPPPPAPSATPSTSGSTRAPSASSTPAPAPLPAPSTASNAAPGGRVLTPPTAEQKVFGVGTQPLRMAELLYDIPEGQRIGEFQIGNWLTSCGEGKKLEVTRKTFSQPAPNSYQQMFAYIGRTRGYTMSEVFDTKGVGAAYLITARVMAMDWVGCVRENTTPPQWSGSGKMTIAWEVARSSDGQVVFRTTTQTASTLSSGERRPDGLTYLFITTFGDAIVQVISLPAFRDAVRPPVSASDRPRVSAADATVVRTPPLYRGAITGNMKAILPGVVEVRPGNGTGSGFVIDASGLILTNAHVVRGGDTVKVAFPDGDEVTGTVIKRDAGRDVALIRVDKTGLKPLPIRRGEPTLTEKVYAIGSPRGLSQTVTEGIVSAYRKQQNGLDLIQATAAISPGNSGGPLLDGSGNVIGISQLTRTDGQNLNFFIPIEAALDRLDLRLAGR